MRGRKEGFTFIEVLVALTIFSVIAASIYYSLVSGISIWSNGNDAIQRNQKLRVTFDIMGQDMKNAVPFSLTKPDSGSKSESEWRDDRVVFYSIVKVYGQGPIHNELAKVIYYFDKETKRLIRKCAKKDEGFNEKNAKEEILYDSDEKADLQDVSIEYAYSDSVGEGYEWKNEWPADAPMPRGIRIRITLKEKGIPEESFEKTVLLPMGKLGGAVEA